MGHHIGPNVHDCHTDVTLVAQIGKTYVLPTLMGGLLGCTKEPKKQMQTSVSASKSLSSIY